MIMIMNDAERLFLSVCPFHITPQSQQTNLFEFLIFDQPITTNMQNSLQMN